MDKQRSMIVAHRGVHNNIKSNENTIPAFISALELKVDMIETDIHETKDGEIIIHHDDFYNSKKWDEINYYDLEKPPLLYNSCIPYFKEIPVDIEIKSCHDIDNIYSNIKNISDGSIISSFNIRILKKLSRKGIQIPLLLILSKSKKRKISEKIRATLYLKFPFLVPRYLTGLSVHYKIINNDTAKKIKKHNLLLYLWTVNKKESFYSFSQEYIDGFITNNPALLMQS